MLADVLRGVGYEVAVAHDAPQALELAARFCPSIALLDIGLPVMDGYELARHLRERLASPPRLVAVSGYGHEADLARSRAAGFEVHLGKPVQLDDVSALGRVDVVLLDDGSAAATWIEFADGKASFKMRRVTPSGERTPAMTVSGLAAGRASGYPRMARFGDELVFAWTESGTPAKVLTARLGLGTLRTSLAR